MYHFQHLHRKILATVIACAMPISLTHANGFRVPEVSVTGTASSNALVANTTELGAIAYNPAANSFHSGRHLLSGVNGVSYEATVTPTGGTRTDSQGKDFFAIPNFLLSIKGDDKLGFALLINAPFGLETNYPDETFPTFMGAADALEPELSRIKMLNFNPNLSYKIDENRSVAFGLDYYEVIDLSFNT